MTEGASNRRARRAAVATGAVEPAIAASTERAAIERDPADAPAAVVGDVPRVPAADVPATDAAVLPEPTLVAKPDAPQPIVTASPILAVEPSAIDVVQADAAADRVAAGIAPAADRDGPHLAAAGQPTLTIEGTQASAVAHALADGALDGLSENVADVFGEVDGLRTWGLSAESGVPNLDDLLDDLRVIMIADADACARVLDELLPIGAAGRPIAGELLARDDFRDNAAGYRPASTVSVIEVVGPLNGRRRAGLTFGPQPRRFLGGDLTEDQIASLRADPLLAVGVSEVDEADVAAHLGTG